MLSTNKNTIGYWFFADVVGGFDSLEFKELTTVTAPREMFGDILSIIKEFELDTDRLKAVDVDPNTIQMMDWAEEDDTLKYNYFACLFIDMNNIYLSEGFDNEIQLQLI